jgi:hypothetical protein
MDCRQANRLLPLWVGHDLPDTAETEALRVHVTMCPRCRERQRLLQESLEVLQSVSTATLAVEMQAFSRPSLWPRVAASLPAWSHERDRFNGWIPAGAMALAAALMVAVSISSVRREMGNTHPFPWTLSSGSPSDGRNLFATDARFSPESIRIDENRSVRPTLAVPVSQPNPPHPNW